MARIRTIKPDFFRHERLFEAERASGLPLRVSFAGLWTACDREGRFVWKPRQLKLDVLPYDEIDFGDVLDALHEHGFIVRYQVGDQMFGHIPSWADHQHINSKELASRIPAPDQDGARIFQHQTKTVTARGEREEEGKGREGESEGEERAASPRAPLKTQSLPQKPTAKRGERWRPDGIVPDEWLEQAAGLRELSKLPPIDLRLEATKFQNYWASRSDRGAIKLDWKRTFFNWCLDSKGASNGRSGGQSGQTSGHPFGPFGAALERELDQSGHPENPDAPILDLRPTAG